MPPEVLVVGAGVMGTAIADTFAAAGVPTALLSRNPERVGTTRAEVRIIEGLPEAPPSLVIEAVPEDLELKVELFRRLQARYGDLPVLASNSSGLPLQEIADRLDSPVSFLGIHYFHPARELPLVEVVRTADTSDEALETARRMLSLSDRDCIVVAKPIPGALINRLQHAILHEAYHLMSRGIATAEDIDKSAKWLLGPRMCISGLLEQKDLGGLEGHARAQRTIVPDLCHDDTPNPLVQEMLARGELGVRTGKGFYDWDKSDPEQVSGQAAERLRELLLYLEDHDS